MINNKAEFFQKIDRQGAGALLLSIVILFANPALAQAMSDSVKSVTNSGLSLQQEREFSMHADAFPPEFMLLLETGVTVPLRVVGMNRSEEAGSAEIRHAGKFLTLDALKLANNNHIEPRYQQIIEQNFGKPLQYLNCSVNSKLEHKSVAQTTTDSQQVSLCFDPLSFELIIDLPQDAFLSSEVTSRKLVLPDSTQQYVSGVFNYNGALSKSEGNSVSSYFTLRSKTSYGVHNLIAEGDFQDNGERRLYELSLNRDYHGIVASVGYLNLWSLSKLGSVSFTGGGKFIGTTLGSGGESVRLDSSLSLIPIFVFMPNSGQVAVYRDNQLISVQSLPIGSQEVDTRPFPTGRYTVRIDKIVDGKVAESQTAAVNKVASSKSKGTYWQLFAGNYLTDDNQDDTHLMGVSGQWLTDLASFRSSLYSYSSFVVVEPGVSRDFKVNDNWHGNVNGQFGVTSEGSNYGNLTLNVTAYRTNFWTSYNVSHKGRKNIGNNANRIYYGTSFNLPSFMGDNRLSTVSLNSSYDFSSRYRNYRANLSQGLYANSWMSSQLNGGYSWSGYSHSSLDHEYYVGLSFMFQFGIGGIDYSRSLESESIGANFTWSPTYFEGLDYLGGRVSRNRTLSSGSISTHVGVNAGGKNRFFTWDGAVDKSNDNASPAVSGSMSGSAGWNLDGIGLSHSQSDAGVIVKIDKSAVGALELLIDERSPQQLDSRWSFVPMSAFQEVNVRVRNSVHSPHNFDIKNNEKELVLYPGNVASVNPELRRLVTVFGVLTEDGKPKAGVLIQNHIGSAKTEIDGSFVVDVDTSNPSVIYQFDNQRTCQIDFDLRNAVGVLWVNEVSCQAEDLKFTRLQ